MDAFKAFCEKYRKDPETGKEQLRDPAGRRRAGRHRHGDRRLVGWRARLHLDRRSRHFADERTARASAYYAEIPGGHHRRAAGGSVDRHADAHAASRTSCSCAYASHGDTKHILLFPANPAECFEFAVKAFDLAEQFPDARVPDVRSRHRHERLGGAAPEMGRFLPPEPRPCARRRRAREAAEVSPLLARATRTTSRRARCPASARRVRTLRAAPATTSSAGTPRCRTSTRT